MDYVTAHPWSFGLFCFCAGYWIALWLHRRAIHPVPAEPIEISGAEIEAAARAGRYVDAIKLYRQRSGAGLKEAKAAVDAIVQRIGN